MSNTETNNAALPMKWHKFLINFALWLTALSHLSNTALYGSGLLYVSLGVSPDQMYAAAPALSTLDKGMAVCAIALMVLSIVTRFSLARYEAKGPGLLTKLYLFTALQTLAYALILSGILGGSALDSNTVSSLAGAIIMIFCHKKYYGRRAHLFVN